MGRAKQYDREEVLEQVLDSFRARGFHRTSMRDLSKDTKLNLFSLYSEFENKNKLFARVLRDYQQKNLNGLRKVQQLPLTGFEKIARLFEGLVKQIKMDKQSLGCLKVNTSVMAKSMDEEVASALKHYDQDAIQFFHEVVEKGQEDGSIKKEASAKELSALLYATHHGIRVLQHTMKDEMVLNQIVDGMLKSIKT